MNRISLTCNGEPVEVEATRERLLVEALREDLGLTGTKVGCGTGDCGACTVLIDDVPVNACIVYAAECEGAHVETIEGISRSLVGAAVVEQMTATGGVQCGICIPGFVVSATSAIRHRDIEDDDTLRERLSGNLCRCTGYYAIVDAVRRAAETVGRS